MFNWSINTVRFAHLAFTDTFTGGWVGGWVGGWLDYAKLKLTSAPNLSWVGTGAELCNITETGDNHQNIRRSKREHKQRIIISPDEIGECDDKNDKDYK